MLTIAILLSLRALFKRYEITNRLKMKWVAIRRSNTRVGLPS